MGMAGKQLASERNLPGYIESFLGDLLSSNHRADLATDEATIKKLKISIGGSENELEARFNAWFNSASFLTERGCQTAFDILFHGGKFDQAVELYNRFESLLDNPIAQHRYLVCLNKKSNSDASLVLEYGRRLIEEGVESADLYGAMGKAHRLLENDEYSFEYYLLGLLKTGSYYNAINAAHQAGVLGWDNESTKLARLAAELAGSLGNNGDYWSAATMCEAAILCNDVSLFKRSLSNLEIEISREVPQDWQISSTVKILEKLDSKIEEESDSKRYPLASEALTWFEGLSSDSPVERGGNDPLIDTSYSYRGLGQVFTEGVSFSGSMKFGGQLADHSVSIFDWEFFSTLVKSDFTQLVSEDLANELEDEFGVKRLVDVESMEDFNTCVDRLIRWNFDTAGKRVASVHGINPDGGLERFGEVHEIFDDTVQEINRRMSEGYSLTDSRISLSVSWTMGLGDCRHHAQAKQMLFDSWQDLKLKNLINDWVVSSDSEAINKIRSLLNRELRIGDVILEDTLAESQSGAYGIVYDSSTGLPLLDSSGRTRSEEHSLNFDVDASGAQSETNLVDSFYQNGPDLRTSGGVKFLPQSSQLWKLEPVRRRAVDASGMIVEIPIGMVPAGHAGQRGEKYLGETGSPLFMGFEVDLTGLTEIYENRRGVNQTLVMDREVNPMIRKEIYVDLSTPEWDELFAHGHEATKSSLTLGRISPGGERVITVVSLKIDGGSGLDYEALKERTDLQPGDVVGTLKIEANNTTEPGDWIITGQRGEEYIVTKEKIDQLYQVISAPMNLHGKEGMHTLLPIGEAVRVVPNPYGSPVRITAPWLDNGQPTEQVGSADCLFVSQPDGSDRYILEGQVNMSAFTLIEAGQLTAADLRWFSANAGIENPLTDQQIVATFGKFSPQVSEGHSDLTLTVVGPAADLEASAAQHRGGKRNRGLDS